MPLAALRLMRENASVLPSGERAGNASHEPGGGDVSRLFSCPSSGRRNTPSGRPGPSWLMTRRERLSGVQAIVDGIRLTLGETWPTPTVRSGPPVGAISSTRLRPPGHRTLERDEAPIG